MDKKIIVTVLAGLAVLGVGFALYKSNKSTTMNREVSTTAPAVNQSTSTVPDSQNVKTFTVNGSNYAFSPSTIAVKKGDTVKIIFKDDDGRHNLVVDGYNVSTNIIEGGTSDSIGFVADKSGKFEYYCSVDGHRELGMKGKLVVE